MLSAEAPAPGLVRVRTMGPGTLLAYTTTLPCEATASAGRGCTGGWGEPRPIDFAWDRATGALRLPLEGSGAAEAHLCPSTQRSNATLRH